MSWDIGAGILLNLTKHINIEASYKYISIGKIKGTNALTINGTPTTTSFSKDKYISEVSGGVIINF
ncbi:MAG: hypothetical protein HRU36_01830 [Rickettsiales bacterium]|nr:hypothetical protein [Rickettsiales bacterium]